MTDSRWKIVQCMAPEPRYRLWVLFEGENKPRLYAFSRHWWESSERFRRRIKRRLDASD